MVTSRFVVALFAAGRQPVVLDVGLSASVLLFTLGTSLATGIGFGLVPALRATRMDLTPALKEGGTTGSSHHRLTTGNALVVAQIALCALVISIAGLLTRTLINLKSRAVRPLIPCEKQKDSARSPAWQADTSARQP